MRHDWIDWISIDEWVRREAEQPKGSTVIHGTDGRIEINGTPIGTVTKWSIDYDRAAERGKSMKNKHRISALEREVKQLMGTVATLREQQRSNSSAVRSAIVSIADHEREQSSNATVLRDLIAKVRQHEIDHSEVKTQPAEQLTAEQRGVRDYLTNLTSTFNQLRAEMQKGDRELGEIITNNRNHAILDKRHAEQQIAAGLNTMQGTNNERLTALEEWAKLTEQHNEKLNHLELEQSALSHRITHMRCSVSLDMYDDLRERVALVEKLIDNAREQTNPTTIPTLSERVAALENADPINFTRKACAELSAQMVKQVTDILDRYIIPFKQRLDAIATLRAQSSEQLSARVTHLEHGTIKPLSEQLDTLKHAVADLHVECARDSVLKHSTDDRATETQAFTVRLYNDIEKLSARLERVEHWLNTKNAPQGNQLYQLDPTYGYIAVEPPVWYSELPALLQSLRSEIDALLAAQSSTIAAEIARVSGRVSQTREYVEQLHDRVDTVSKSAHTHHPG